MRLHVAIRRDGNCKEGEPLGHRYVQSIVPGVSDAYLVAERRSWRNRSESRSTTTLARCRPIEDRSFPPTRGAIHHHGPDASCAGLRPEPTVLRLIASNENYRADLPPPGVPCIGEVLSDQVPYLTPYLMKRIMFRELAAR